MTQLCQSPALEILFCITVYNEPGSALLYSLAGIKQNLDHLVRAGKRYIAERVTVCLIFDGQEHISASALALLKSLKLYTGEQPISEAAIHIFDSKLDLSLVERCIDVDVINSKLTNNWWDAYQFTLQKDEIIESDFELNADEPLSPRVLLCIKKENAGKLNSHWWFFTILSAYLCPKYCVQMDVGSIPGGNAIDELWQFLEMHPDVGAATGSILVPEPRQFLHFLSVWQFGNFFLDKLLFRPAEDIAGYLSVLSGQFSMFRWQALTTDWTDKPLSTEQPSPLKKYFRGLEQLGAFEATMFLVEDRVLGFELVTSLSTSWKLAFFPSVVTITDPCQSLSELLRQRRRWINGSLACRVWSFVQIPEYLCKQEVSIARKCRFLSSVPLYLIRLVTEWFFPSFVILLTTLIYKTLNHILVDFRWATEFINLAFTLCIGLFVAQILLCQFPAQYDFLLKVNIIYGNSFVLAALVILTISGHYLPLVVIILLLLTIYSIAKIHSQTLSMKVWGSLLLYFLINCAYTCLLYAHAFFNIHDRSWGTKGLTRSQLPNKRFNQFFFIFWLLSNLCLLLAAFSFQSSIPTLILFGQLDFLIGILAGLVTAIPIVKRRHFAKNS